MPNLAPISVFGPILSIFRVTFGNSRLTNIGFVLHQWDTFEVTTKIEGKTKMVESQSHTTKSKTYKEFRVFSI